MARPREFNPDDVLDQAVQLFWEKGYSDMSVDELVRRSGVAKYGIYGTFGPKRELFSKALQRYAEDRQRDIQAPLRKPGAGLPEIRKFFKLAVKMTTAGDTPRGCLIVSSALEMAERDEALRSFAETFFTEIETVMAGCLENAVNAGQLRAPDNLPRLSAYLVGEFRLLLLLAGSGVGRDRIKSHLKIALGVLD